MGQTQILMLAIAFLFMAQMNVSQSQRAVEEMYLKAIGETDSEIASYQTAIRQFYLMTDGDSTRFTHRIPKTWFPQDSVYFRGFATMHAQFTISQPSGGAYIAIEANLNSPNMNNKMERRTYTVTESAVVLSQVIEN